MTSEAKLALVFWAVAMFGLFIANINGLALIGKMIVITSVCIGGYFVISGIIKKLRN